MPPFNEEIKYLESLVGKKVIVVDLYQIHDNCIGILTSIVYDDLDDNTYMVVKETHYTHEYVIDSPNQNITVMLCDDVKMLQYIELLSNQKKLKKLEKRINDSIECFKEDYLKIFK